MRFQQSAADWEYELFAEQFHAGVRVKAYMLTLRQFLKGTIFV